MADPTDEEAREKLGEALLLASAAAKEFRTRRDAALQRNDYPAYDKLSKAYSAAVLAENAATQKLIAQLVNPTGPEVASLSRATKKLNDRLERLRQSEAQLNDLANIVDIFTIAIKGVGML
ncbi:MAG TPA: hypothetical protein VF620_14445 [Allosphingosinicella sp.]|jgi:GTP1/Obg family GTP-binding protein